jgi:hypothetical protein
MRKCNGRSYLRFIPNSCLRLTTVSWPVSWPMLPGLLGVVRLLSEKVAIDYT